MVFENPLSAQVFYAWQNQPGEKILRLTKFGNTVALLTNQRILQLENGQWTVKWTADMPLTAAAVVGNNIWAGGNSGLSRIDGETWQSTDMSFEGNTAVTGIAAVETAAAGDKAIISSYQAGVFETDRNSLRKIGTEYDVNAVCDCGGYCWLGTNAGLVRIKADEVVTYTEEGVKGFEIPDNVVDALYCPNGNKLVAIMPEAIDFLDLSNQSSASHGEHFDYVGERDNTVTDVLPMPGGSLLLLTEKGLLLLEGSYSAVHDHGEYAFKEVFSGNEHAQVIPVQLGAGGWQKAFFDTKGYAWLVSDGNSVKIKAKKLLKLANAQRAQG
jgi:hypothetical protein